MWGQNRAMVWRGTGGFPGEGTPLELQLADAGPVWAEIARKHKLVSLISGYWRPHGTRTPTSAGRSKC